MFSQNSWKMILLLGLCLFCVMQPSSGHANVTYTVSLDTSALVGLGQSFTLDFILIGGDDVFGNNAVTLSNFNFNPGQTPVTLTDSVFFNEFQLAFNPLTSLLSFDLNMTTNVAEGTPDSFTFAILDGSGIPIPTIDWADNFLAIDFDSPTLTIATYGTDPELTNVNINAPGLQQQPSSVPEPATLFLMSSGLAGLALVRKLKRNS